MGEYKQKSLKDRKLGIDRDQEFKEYVGENLRVKELERGV